MASQGRDRSLSPIDRTSAGSSSALGDYRSAPLPAVTGPSTELTKNVSLLGSLSSLTERVNNANKHKDEGGIEFRRALHVLQMYANNCCVCYEAAKECETKRRG